MNFHYNSTSPIDEQLKNAQTILDDNGRCTDCECEHCPLNEGEDIECADTKFTPDGHIDADDDSPHRASYMQAFIALHKGE